MTNPDIIVTAAEPLIISDTSALTQYGAITIVAGGCIKITAACVFTADSITKTQPTTPAANPYPFDIIVVGITGTNGSQGGTGKTGDHGITGHNLECSPTGVRHSPADGSSGITGHPGDPGADDTGNGKPGPNVTINVGNLQSNLTVSNSGGTGGKGGQGGTGGTGGQGGTGGKGGDCSGHKRSGGDGGQGGAGGDGGKGGTGGAGGDGGELTLYFTSRNGSVLQPQSIAAPGGMGGVPGVGGAGGAGGAGGDNNRGPHNGNMGAKGADGQPGQPGKTNDNNGKLGKIFINPKLST